jgi:MFS transporter, OFA family, oxalate/formate antiporter
MNPPNDVTRSTTSVRNPIFYGWIIVAACFLLQTIQVAIQYGFSVFFKPLAADFGWSRTATSGAYSVLMLSAGITAIPLGWLGDRFGPSKVLVGCSFIIGLSLVLTSRVTELWQFYLTYGFLQGLGMGGTYAIATGLTSRWFVKKRGLAMGLVSSGVGVGTLLGPPISERLITNFGWSSSYMYIGFATWVIMIGASIFLRRDPRGMGLLPYGADAESSVSNTNKKTAKKPADITGMTMSSAIHTRQLWLLIFLFLLFSVCVQLILVHLVNYATDLGIDSFTAATIVSVIGIGSIAGRLFMGSMSDRIGEKNAMMIAALGLLAALVLLIFSNQLWMLYTFAILFSVSYGAEVTLMPLLSGRIFGLAAVMALTGMVSAAARIGGAFGSWMGGAVFDLTQSYLIAFAIAAIFGLIILGLAITLKRTRTQSY